MDVSRLINCLPGNRGDFHDEDQFLDNIIAVTQLSKFGHQMAHLTTSYVQMQGNSRKIIMLAPKIHVGMSTKMGRCARLKVFRRSGKGNVGMIRMCGADRVPNDDSDHEKSSLAFGDDEGVIYSGSQEEEDWRTFRARLVYSNSSVLEKSDRDQRPINLSTAEWAHEITSVEEGCVLVATDKLKSHPLLSKSVVLLLRWSSSSSECTGIVLNKTFPSHCGIYMDLADSMLKDLCLPTFMGGPALGGPGFGSRFHILTTQKGLPGFQSVVPGLYVGNKGVCLQSAMRGGVGMGLYLGEMELAKRHVEAQVEAFGWWKVVACSSHAIFSGISSPTDMWQNMNHRLTE